MLADQFHEAVAGARSGAALDELARKLRRAHAEGHLSDADAEAISEAVEEARRAVVTAVPEAPRASRRVSRARPRREKMFGLGRPRALDRNAKVRIMPCTGRGASPAGPRRAGHTASSQPRRWPCSRRFCGPSTTPGVAQCAPRAICRSRRDWRCGRSSSWRTSRKSVRTLPRPRLRPDGKRQQSLFAT